MAIRRTLPGWTLAATLLVAASLLSAQSQAAARARALLQVEAGGSGGEQTIVLRIVGEGRTLASYQGVITFNRRQLEIASAVSPPDGYRVVNIADTTESRLRFAGFATNGFQHDTALTLRVRSRGPAASLTVKLEVVGDVVGKPFPTSALSGTTITLPATRKAP